MRSVRNFVCGLCLVDVLPVAGFPIQRRCNAVSLTARHPSDDHPPLLSYFLAKCLDSHILGYKCLNNHGKDLEFFLVILLSIEYI